MDRLLRSDEISGLIKKAFSYENNIIYFPIRHHSPMCSLKLKEVIDSYKPECILIEGPSNVNSQLHFMADPETKAPIAFYYSYKDSKGYVSDEKESYKCYYPFLDYSPELVAVREAAVRCIKTQFIDLPYEEILIASAENARLRADSDKVSYNDDHYLSESTFLKKVAENSGLRCFDEFWEKHFEMISGTAEEFVEKMLYYCVLSRANASKETLKQDGCLAREAYMRSRIEEEAGKYSRVLVVTGGFHTAGLLYPDFCMEKPEFKTVSKAAKGFKLHKTDPKDLGFYLIAYSMQAADALNGYASGMPFPAYYQRVWEKLTAQDSDRDEAERLSSAYKDSCMDFLVSVGKSVRKKEGYPSTFDEICAVQMCDGLANLRGKQAPGAYELSDSVISNYIKGEMNMATDRPMKTLRAKLTGNAIGKLCSGTLLPPIIQDFEDTCKKFKIDISTSAKKELSLSIFKTERHRKISEFLHRLSFLENSFARRVKGVNLAMRKDRNLITEKWDYRWTEEVIMALIDKSVYGSSIEEACSTLVMNKLSQGNGAADVSRLIISLFEMGLRSCFDTAQAKLQAVIYTDDDFFSLTMGLSNIIMLMELTDLYRSDLKLEDMRKIISQRIMVLLPQMAGIKDEELGQVLDALKELFRLYQSSDYIGDRDYFTGILEKMLDDKQRVSQAQSIKNEMNPGLEGAIYGILYSCGKRTIQQVGEVIRGYLQGTKDRRLMSASFIRGIFFTARDIVFADDSILEMMDDFIKHVDADDFVKCLPGLRLAWSYYTPVEMDRIAKRVAVMYGLKGSEMKKLRTVTPDEYEYGASLEKQILEVMSED